LTVSGPDTPQSAPSRARRTIPGRNGGTLTPFRKGEGRPIGRGTPITMIQTLQLARRHSVDAVRTLVRALDCEDQRVAVTAANLLLERGWGKPREAPVETPHEAEIDLSQLSNEELRILAQLVTSGRLRPAVADAPPEIEVKIDKASD
jgi:hypothetical protein